MSKTERVEVVQDATPEVVSVKVGAVDNETSAAIGKLEQWCQSLVVRSVEDRNAVIEQLKLVKAQASRVKEFFAESKDLAYKTWKSITGKESAIIDRLNAIEAAAKRAVVAFDEIEQKRIAAEQARLQREADEKARREREAFEQAAARKREEEARARAEAEEKRRQAEQASAAERKRLQDEADAAERAANRAAAAAEAKEVSAVEVIAPVVVAPVAAVPAAKGASTRTEWYAEVVDEALVPREYLTINIDALNGLARATKGSIKGIPGVVFKSRQVLAIRSK